MELRKVTSVLLLLTIMVTYVNSAKILVFDPVGTHSTRISMFPFMEALADHGHQVTFLSAYDNIEDPNSKSKISYFTPPKWKASMGPWEDHTKFFDVRKQGLSVEVWWDFQDLGIKACETLYSDPVFVNWVKSSTFDLVVIESVTNDCGYGLAHYWGTKVVVYGTTTILSWFPDSHGLPDESSTIPDLVLDIPAGDKMTFWQRVKNAITPIAFTLKREWTFFPKLEEITRKGLGLGPNDLPSFREMEKNVSLVLVTTHFTIDLPRSLPPHVIPIGGAVAGSKIMKPMTPEMQTFVDGAKKGFFLISFGTVAAFTNFDEEVRVEFIKALAAHPEIRFLWRSEETILEKVPGNVMVTKWVPQQTALAHKNIKGFITHAGMGSSAELVHFAVPAILIPVLADQDVLAKTLEARGVGIRIEVITLKQKELEHAISEILHNSKYRIAMKKLSESFKDRPAAPAETGAWWVDYILRHPNSNDYMVPLSVRQSWWKRRQIDVWLSVGAALITVLYVFVAILWKVVKAVVGGGGGGDKKGRKVKSN